MQHLTELEEKLARPGGFALQQDMLAALEAAALRLRQQLAASVPRADFEMHKKTIDAVQAAIEVLQAWPVLPETQALNAPLLPNSARFAAALQIQAEAGKDLSAARPDSSDIAGPPDFLNRSRLFPFVNPTRSFS